MDQDDPISQFFPGEESVDLYAVLSLKSDATIDDIKKSYRRQALIYHPDKHATANEKIRADASTKFQQIGFAYTVLSDEKRRQRYDRTGQTDEGFELQAGEDGWEAYFEAMFDRVTRGKLDEMKREYQGSAEEVEDIKNAYMLTAGSIGEIMTYIPHSMHEDEARIIILISDLISTGDLPVLPEWTSSVKDEKARLVRQKQGQKEAREAEVLAKELGVWDEFYGSGKEGARKTKGTSKGKGKKEQGDGDIDDDTSILQALMLKRKKNTDSFFDGLAAKYANPPSKKSKRGAPEPPPDIDDEEFERLQSQLFKDKAKPSTAESNGKKTRRGRVAA